MTSPQPSESDARITVERLLSAAGVAVPDNEIDRLAGLYPGLRASVDKLHALDAGDEVQAAIFRPGDGEGGRS